MANKILKTSFGICMIVLSMLFSLGFASAEITLTASWTNPQNFTTHSYTSNFNVYFNLTSDTDLNEFPNPDNYEFFAYDAPTQNIILDNYGCERLLEDAGTNTITYNCSMDDGNTGGNVVSEPTLFSYLIRLYDDSEFNNLLVEATHNNFIIPYTYITGCTTITESGYYELTNNFTALEEICINILADNVILEGNGNYIFHNNPISSTPFAILIGDINFVGKQDNVEVRNINLLQVSNTSYQDEGIAVFGDQLSTNITLTNITSVGFQVPFDLENVVNSTITNIYSKISDITSAYSLYLYGLDNVNITNYEAYIPDSYITIFRTWFVFDGISNVNIKNLTLSSNNGYAKIQEFTTSGSSSADITSINISNNLATIDTSTNDFLNTSSTIALYNLPFTNPRILKNGVLCNDCSNLVYAEGTATFDVTGWSNYSLEESPVTPETTPSYQSEPTYQVLSSSGAGLGKFLEYVANSLPLLILMFMLVALITGIGYAIAHLIKTYIK